jgi:hypothetical protein
MEGFRTMRFTTTTSILLLAIASQSFGQARVIITEIMYNPASSENKSETEWVEIANVGTESIDIKDWRLDDEDKPQWGKFSCTLAAGEVAVLINSAAVTEEQFRAAWDEMEGSAAAESSPKYQVISVKWAGISNKPSADNEVLQLRNDKDEVVCEVKQEGQWPSCDKPDGPSLALTAISATTFNDGRLWVRSQDGEHGARLCRKTDIFGGKDIGSPGFVPGLSGAKVVSKPDETVPKEEVKPAVKDSNTIDY